MSSTSFISVEQSDFTWAAQKGYISSEQAAALWPVLVTRAQGRGWTIAQLAFYTGAFIIIGAMTWFLDLAWQNSHEAMFILSGSYVVAFAVAGYLMWRDGQSMGIPQAVGGVLTTVSVCLVPVFVGAGQEWADWFFKPAPGLTLELPTLLVGLVAIYFEPFAFLTLPIAAATYAFVMVDLERLLWTQPEPLEMGSMSISWGLGMLAVALYIDRQHYQQDFAFWGYFFGSSAVWGALTWWFSVYGNYYRLAYALISGGFMVVAVVLNRVIFVIYGGVGVFGYLTWLAWDIFQDSWMFPFVLTLLGILIIYVGIKISQWFGGGGNYLQKKNKTTDLPVILPEAQPAKPVMPMNLQPAAYFPDPQAMVAPGAGYVYLVPSAVPQDSTSIEMMPLVVPEVTLEKVTNP